MEPTILDAIKNKGTGIPAPSLGGIASASYEDGIEIAYDCNLGSYMNGETYASNGEREDIASVTKGVMFRYKTDSYPINHNDGTLAFIDEDIFLVNEDGSKTAKNKSRRVVGLETGKTYYFTAFPYSTYGVYNEMLSRANCTKCQWTGTKGTLTVNVTRDFDYLPLDEYTVTLTPTAGGDAITKTQSGEGAVVFSGVEGGEYTLSFSGVNHFIAPSSQKITVNAGQPNNFTAQYKLHVVLSDLSWNEIDAISQGGNASNFFSVGNTIDVQVLGQQITFMILGFNQDAYKGSKGEIGITFGMKHLLKDLYKINSSISPNRNFWESELQSFLDNDVYNSLPSDLKSVIKPAAKLASIYKDGIQQQAWATKKLFLLGEYEITGKNDKSHGAEGPYYSAYLHEDLLEKKLSNGTGEPSKYWLRTLPTNDTFGETGFFCCVSDKGEIQINNDVTENALCFCFCV